MPQRPGDEIWEREFRRLRETYKTKLEGDLRTLDAMLRGARGPEAPRLELEAARQLAHRLKGTAGTFQLDECCAALAQVEELVDRLLAEPSPDPAPIWADIDRCLAVARSGTG